MPHRILHIRVSRRFTRWSLVLIAVLIGGLWGASFRWTLAYHRHHVQRFVNNGASRSVELIDSFKVQCGVVVWQSAESWYFKPPFNSGPIPNGWEIAPPAATAPQRTPHQYAGTPVDYYAMFGLWIPFLAALGGAGLTFRIHRAAGSCPKCGYGRQGLPSEVCPECGTTAAGEAGRR